MRGASVSQAEAKALIDCGKYWLSKVWLVRDKNYGDRDKLIEEMNKGLKDLDMKVGRGWQPTDPIVRVSNKPHTYKALVEWAISQPDGGVEAAKLFLKWVITDTVTLGDLGVHLKALAVITHFAEVGRGYGLSLKEYLYPWMEEIASAGSKEAAKVLWGKYREKFPPALKYDEDLKKDFTD